MGKRAIADLIADEDAVINSDSLSRKKSRKDKSDKIRKPRNESTANSTAREDGNQDSAVAVNGNSEEREADDEKLARAERKAAKMARKEAKEASRVPKSPIDGSNAAVTTASRGRGDEELAKATRKAARKAEKKRLKKLAKAEAADMGSTPASSEVTSNSTSAIASRNESSATSPEPIAELASKYSEHPELTGLPQSEIDSYLASNFINIEDPFDFHRRPRPIIKFTYLPTSEAQRAAFASFAVPTPIQAAAWPSLLSGRDMIGVAETGSGKTLAFGVPCVSFISSLPKKQQKGVKAVMVSPTRELASQIYDQLVKLATPAGLEVVCVYGGVAKEPQVKAIRTAHIVVATPGRLNDLISDGSADLSKAEYVVLDEADRMLDKGFEEAIRQIIQCTPQNRQTLMFTATWPPSVRDLASTFMKSPVKINIGNNPTGELRANTRIKQLVEVVEPRNKEFRLLQLLKKYQSGQNKDDRILVFCLYKKEATRIENFIHHKGFRVAGIHGDLSQDKRTASLDLFKKGEVPILVATDVAARGLDIPAVKLVINVTFPLTAEDYVHRIGRTGRAGKEGLAVTMFTEHDKALSGALINVLKAANQEVPEELMKFGTTVKKKGHDAYGAHYKEIDPSKKASKITFD
ncbi:DEAD-domain-containing protein [Lindgomyces ingoldianus]|uniref:DEAD-domain-containing protein n=1 Tax=Lindgomyces ingoldianus TaxID=673940 RepID=A0ACB6RGD1_9PLEO|nr:DEAD-domain-containing protein [Lindgomyces ingoldianus]KAF2477818.1 DEAD-domain-containing protein [Lindgomyces ingoldianus]